MKKEQEHFDNKHMREQQTGESENIMGIGAALIEQENSAAGAIARLV